MPNQEPKKSYKFFAPKVFIRTFGCQMNIRDTEVICGLLKTEGWKLTDSPGEADVVLFNTCSVRQHAEDKVWSEIGRIVKTRGESPTTAGSPERSRGKSGESPLIGLVGCMAQEHKEKAFERAAAIDFVVGPSDIQKIPEILSKLYAKRYTLNAKGKKGQSPISPFFTRKIWETDGGVRPEEIYHTGFYEDKDHAYVVISEGCSNYCSYCVVPYVRGQLQNRNYKNILQEIEEGVDRGITKITLLGQNVNAYGKNKGQSPSGTVPIFPELLRMVNEIKGLEEFSFITSHPKDTSIDLFKAMAGLGKLKKYLHLPVQSGSDKILKLMNRGYTRSCYLNLAKEYRKIVKGGALTTDIIVGFPGETKEDFNDTYGLVKEVGFNSAYIFKYSARPYTKAAKLNDDVAKEEKERRHRIILELQKEISKKCKMQNEKRKIKVQNSKLLVLSFGFALYALNFTHPCYALDLTKLKTDFLSGEYESAIKEGENILASAEKDGRLDELYYFLGLSYLKNGNFLRASDIFEIILNEFKKSPFRQEAKLGIGDTYFLRKDYKAAEKYYEQLLDDRQSKLMPSVYYRLSLTSAKLGNTVEAKKYLDKLKQDYPLSLEVKANNDLLALTDFYYTVQVGAFSNIVNAKNLVQKLIQKGYPAYIEEARSADKINYRVRVGRLASRKEAEGFRDKLMKVGYPTKIFP